MINEAPCEDVCPYVPAACLLAACVHRLIFMCTVSILSVLMLFSNVLILSLPVYLRIYLYLVSTCALYLLGIYLRVPIDFCLLTSSILLLCTLCILADSRYISTIYLPKVPDKTKYCSPIIPLFLMTISSDNLIIGTLLFQTQL